MGTPAPVPRCYTSTMSKFDPQTPEAIADRLTDLKRKLAARQGKNEFRDNVPAIESEIARLEAL